jgi:hypothetical protein
MATLSSSISAEQRKKCCASSPFLPHFSQSPLAPQNRNAYKEYQAVPGFRQYVLREIFLIFGGDFTAVWGRLMQETWKLAEIHFFNPMPD